ncbi:MAG: hypothetical protein AVDCRST_MAG55-1628, partial [uncultured Rubrobacteraceae bacterium]
GRGRDEGGRARPGDGPGGGAGASREVPRL